MFDNLLDDMVAILVLYQLHDVVFNLHGHQFTLIMVTQFDSLLDYPAALHVD